jgi:hypothetical protein
VTNTEAATLGIESCEVTACTIKQFDRDMLICANNYTNDDYISTLDDQELDDSEEYWFIRMLDRFSESELYSSKNGVI